MTRSILLDELVGRADEFVPVNAYGHESSRTTHVVLPAQLHIGGTEALKISTAIVPDGASAEADGVRQPFGSSGSLVGDIDPASGDVPPQLESLSGTQFADVLIVTSGTVPPHWVYEVAARGGDDLIVRDRTGAYDSIENDVWIDGGHGFDTVDYAQAVGRIVVDFTFGTVQELAPAWAPPGSLPRGKDFLTSIEAVVGTDQDDIFSGNGNANTMYGGDGADDMYGWGGADTISGGDGDDYIDGGEGNDVVSGGDGDDDILGGGGHDTIHGGDGHDDIVGQDGNDTIYADAGDDVVFGGLGADVVHVGSGDDTVYGGDGDDTVHVAGPGDNTLFGDTGTDTLVIDGPVDAVSLYHGFVDRPDGYDTIGGFENLTTGDDAQSIIGSDVANEIRANGGDDVILGNGGHDEIWAGDGRDHVDGGDGHDTIRGGDGNDTVVGGWGDDTIFGNDGDDTLSGDGGADTIYGDRGTDTIRGGAGGDTLWGAAHADVFVWGVGDTGTDTIGDFSLNQDKLSFLPGFLAAGPITQVLGAFDAGNLGAGLLGFTVDEGLKVIAYLTGVDADALSAKITDGSIFHVATLDGLDGAPDGFEFGGLGGGVLPMEAQGGLLG